MIHPNMATMLAFAFTDLNIDQKLLDKAFREAVDDSFNMITVDGDTSTNDTCLLLATGASGAPRIGRVGDRRLKSFSAALDKVMLDLAQQVVRDGEGASKFITLCVSGAESDASARRIGSGSPVVRCSAIIPGSPAATAASTPRIASSTRSTVASAPIRRRSICANARHCTM